MEDFGKIILCVHAVSIIFLSGSSPTAKNKLLSLTGHNVGLLPGLLTGHSLRRHVHLMGLINSPFRRRGAEEDTSTHVLCEGDVLASLRHAYLDSFILWGGGGAPALF
jgi:hypothetical protein